MKTKNKNWGTKFIVLVVIYFLIGIGKFDFVFAEDKSLSSIICATYFTYIGCPNCASVDPVVLIEWPKKYPNLVIIEYMWRGGDWRDPNSQFFGEFASVYKIHSAVPQIVFNKDNIRLGRLNVPKAEDDIKSLSSNPCPLINKNVFWENLNLNELKAKPKIWANGRILIKLNKNEWLFQWNGESPPETTKKEKFSQKELKELLFTENLSEKLKNKIFHIAKPQKAKFSGVAFPGSGVIPYAEFENAIKIKITEKPAESKISYQAVKKKQTVEEIEIPIFGKIKTAKFSLPALTILLGIVDGLTNPCGFFVIFFLLSALISLAGARKKMILVGGVFIFFFALYYFLFMALLLNIFILGRKIALLTTVAGGICIFAGLLNVKDYFFFQKGISLSLSKGKKLKFEERVKNLSLTKSIPALIVGTTIIASTISLVAIACTFGIPLAYTKILTSKSLPSLQYYLYLVFYNLIYIIPMAIIVLIFAITLGKKTFKELWIRRLKLVSGFIILFLGSLLSWNYVLLENITFIFWLIITAVVLSGLVILIDSLRKRKI
ncbi:MAG: hypothetical protein DRP10_04415 [Candidatus Aenigmatarchaeota archaeon]|nr:MAG: hypothetical protein DRP10_04415 [Candidatus Aenigmarchaeota archaeon]